MRILIADDHDVVRAGLRQLLLEKKGWEVCGEATTGRQAAAMAVELKPDVVVMDIAMPELNGIEATLQIHDVSPSTQVLVLSMHSTTEHIFRALQAGARGYLLKDSAGAEVVDAVRAVHAGRRYLSQKIASAVIDDYISDRQRASPLDSLSRRERQILQMVAEGKSSAEAAVILFLSPKTVDTYRSRMMQKLGIADVPSLVKFAIQHGVTQLE